MIVNDNKHYFLWLIQQVEWYEIDVYEHEDLLRFLFETDFRWTIENDSNRASKGIGLRYEWNKTYDPGDAPCSVLEMLIALSRDWEHEITYDFTKGDRSSKWFWLMLDNLGLLNPRKIPDIPEKSQIWSEKLGFWMDRKFDFNGVGSPFPLKNASRNQKNLEIWLQVNDFVMENVKM